MGKILRVLVVTVALAASAGATMRATDLPSESLVVTASSLGQKALNDPAAFDFVEALTTEIGQRLAGTEAHRRAVIWAEARLKAAGLESVRRLQAGLHSFLSMRRIEARRKNASAFRLRFSQSLASLRQRLSHAMVRSTIQRFGKTTNPLT